jgi:NADPH2:quinone reductase
VRALQVRELIGPDGVGVADVPEPGTGDDQVVVEVRAGGVSFVDCCSAAGSTRPAPTRRHLSACSSRHDAGRRPWRR